MGIHINDFVQRREVWKNLGVGTHLKAEQRLTCLKEFLAANGEAMPMSGIQVHKRRSNGTPVTGNAAGNFEIYHVPYVILSERTKAMKSDIDHFRILILNADNEFGRFAAD